MNLHLDFETCSELNLKIVGRDNYVHHHSTKILMLAWAVDNGPVHLWTPHTSPFPEELRAHILNPEVTKMAWNVGFERSIFLNLLGMDIPCSQWADVMVIARYLSLPGSLDTAGAILGLSTDKAKMAEGKQLIHMFCEPMKEKKRKDSLTLNLFDIGEVPGPKFRDWNSHPEQWAKFEEYCKQDVVAERALFNLMQKHMLSDMDTRGWVLDQKINEAGMPTNKTFAKTAYGFALKYKNEVLSTIGQKTGVKNPNATGQILEWAQTQGYTYGSLEKRIVEMAMRGTDISPLCREVLTIRKESAKTSYKKYEKILDRISDDGRIRDMFTYMGAARTGRWSSYGVQFQNLPKTMKVHEDKLDRLRELILADEYQTIKDEFGSVINAMTSCIRSSFQTGEDSILDICDLGAIENRVIGWASGCKAISDVFEQGRDPYLDFGVEIYNEPYEVLEAEYNSGKKKRRNDAKPATLGCGFGLGGGEEKENENKDIVKTGLMGYAEQNGVLISEEFAHRCVKVFRNKYKEVPKFWRNLENAARKVLLAGKSIKVRVGPVVFDRMKMPNGTFLMRIQLPSGRFLHYVNARIIYQDSKLRRYVDEQGETTSYFSIACQACGARDKVYSETQGFPAIEKGETIRQFCDDCSGETDWRIAQHQAIMYAGVGHGVGATTKGNKWSQNVYTYGGKLTENLVQAISRDILLHGMMLFDAMSGRIVGHVHDEIIAQRSLDDPFAPDLDSLRFCMCVVPHWAGGLLLGAEGYSSKFYRKG